MTPQEQYWKERCEAAEAFITSTTIMEKVASEGKDDQRKLLDNWNVKYHTPEPPAPAQGVEEAAGTYAKGLIGEYDPVYQEEYDAICSHFLSGVEYEKRKQQNAAPNCCARWVKASDALPENMRLVRVRIDQKEEHDSRWEENEKAFMIVGKRFSPRLYFIEWCYIDQSPCA